MQLKDVAASLCELWNLMDTTREDKSKFTRIISVVNSAELDILDPGSLSLEIIQQVVNIPENSVT